jgi:peptidyl-prolyl cis-trans isomerase SurA
MNMKIYRFIAFSIFLVTVLANAGAQLLDTTLATVRLTETEVVYERALTQQISLLEAQFGQTLNAQQKREILESRINSILVNQAARRENLQASDQEIQNAIALQKQALGVQISDAEYQRLVVEQTGISWDAYRDQLADRILQEKYIVFARPNLGQNLPQPSEEEIQTVYEENAQSFLSPAMSGVSHIFIPTGNLSAADKQAARSRMDEYSRRIRNGGAGEYDAIVRESLDDPGFTGGDLGYIISGDQAALQSLGSAFVQQVLALRQGQISGVLESAAGYHIVKVNDRRSPRLLELSDPLLPGQSITVRQNIVSYIMNNRQQQALINALNEIIAELREEAEIRIFEQNLPW